MFELRLTETSLVHLRSVLDHPVSTLLSASLRVQALEDALIYAQEFSFSLGVKRGFLTVRVSDWFDTPTFAINYFKLHIEAGELPYNSEALDTSQVKQPSALSDVMLGHHQIPVTRIDVYEVERQKSDSTVLEQVHFDHAIKFLREDGSQFCLVIDDESIAGDLVLYWGTTAITQALAKSHIRCTVRGNPETRVRKWYTASRRNGILKVIAK